jgi:hypothetical protein
MAPVGAGGMNGSTLAGLSGSGGGGGGRMPPPLPLRRLGKFLLRASPSAAEKMPGMLLMKPLMTYYNLS